MPKWMGCRVQSSGEGGGRLIQLPLLERRPLQKKLPRGEGAAKLLLDLLLCCLVLLLQANCEGIEFRNIECCIVWSPGIALRLLLATLGGVPASVRTYSSIRAPALPPGWTPLDNQPPGERCSQHFSCWLDPPGLASTTLTYWDSSAQMLR